MKSILMALAAVLACQYIHAGEDRGGGDIVILNGKFYLLDLVEAGVQDNPYIDYSIPVSEELLAQTRKALSNIPNVPVDLVARKLAEMATTNKVASEIFLAAMDAYSWRVVSPDIIELNDEKDTVLQIKTYKQLAIRKAKSITISSSLWAKLDALNKAALVFHEITYSLLDAYFNYTWKAAAYPKKADGYYAEASAYARSITGLIFSEEFKYEGLRQFLNELSISNENSDFRIYLDGATTKVFRVNNPQVAVRIKNCIDSTRCPNNSYSSNVLNYNSSFEDFAKVCRQRQIVQLHATRLMVYQNSWINTDYGFHRSTGYANRDVIVLPNGKTEPQNEYVKSEDPYSLSESRHDQNSQYLNIEYVELEYLVPANVEQTGTRFNRKKNKVDNTPILNVEKCAADLKSALEKIVENPFRY